MKKKNKTFLGLDFSPSVAVVAAAIVADDDVTVEMGPLSIPARQIINDLRERATSRWWLPRRKRMTVECPCLTSHFSTWKIKLDFIMKDTV